MFPKYANGMTVLHLNMTAADQLLIMPFLARRTLSCTRSYASIDDAFDPGGDMADRYYS